MLLVFQEGLLFTRQLAVCLPGRVDRFLVLRRELGVDIRGELCNQLIDLYRGGLAFFERLFTGTQMRNLGFSIKLCTFCSKPYMPSAQPE